VHSGNVWQAGLSGCPRTNNGHSQAQVPRGSSQNDRLGSSPAVPLTRCERQLPGSACSRDGFPVSARIRARSRAPARSVPHAISGVACTGSKPCHFRCIGSQRRVGAYLAAAGEGYALPTLRRRVAAIARACGVAGHPPDTPRDQGDPPRYWPDHGAPARRAAALTTAEVKKLSRAPCCTPRSNKPHEGRGVAPGPGPPETDSRAGKRVVARRTGDVVTVPTPLEFRPRLNT
jgi:hypothetical protein